MSTVARQEDHPFETARVLRRIVRATTWLRSPWTIRRSDLCPQGDRTQTATWLTNCAALEAIFVEELEEVPIGARVIFSAMAFSPAVRTGGEGAEPAGDRRDLSAGHESPSRSGQVRQEGLHDHP